MTIRMIPVIVVLRKLVLLSQQLNILAMCTMRFSYLIYSSYIQLSIVYSACLFLFLPLRLQNLTLILVINPASTSNFNYS